MNKYLILGLLFTGMVYSHIMMRHTYKLPYPHFDSLLTKEHPLQDVLGITMGARNVAADIAWIQLIQYTGEISAHHHHHGGEAEEEGGTGENCKEDKLEKLKDMCNRVIRINPYLYESYLFSAGILAWYVDRPNEAIELLKDGVNYSPYYWPFRIYIGAIAYKKSNEFGKMIIYLEEAVKYPGCPTIIRAILANSYKARKQYSKAISVWQSVVDLGETEYKDMAIREIEQLQKIRNSSPLVGEVR